MNIVLAALNTARSSPGMARTLIRPLSTEISAISEFLEAATLTTENRLKLRAVLRWAKGSTFRQVRTELGGKVHLSFVHHAVALYRAEGLPGFSKATGNSDGTPDPVAEKIAEELRRSFESGDEPTYRELAKRHNLSLGKVAKIVKRKKLTPKDRRGQVAPLPPRQARG